MAHCNEADIKVESVQSSLKLVQNLEKNAIKNISDLNGKSTDFIRVLL